jgi:hypothetical protein
LVSSDSGVRGLPPCISASRFAPVEAPPGFSIREPEPSLSPNDVACIATILLGLRGAVANSFHSRLAEFGIVENKGIKKTLDT